MRGRFDFRSVLFAAVLGSGMLLSTTRAWAQAGTLDPTFSPGAGPDGDIYDMAFQADGGILIAGAFTHYNGAPRAHLASLLPDGSLDSTFDPGTNFNAAIGVVNWLTNGQVLVAGAFNAAGGSGVSYLARLNSDGSLDATFDAGISGAISYLSRLPDGRIMVAGGFDWVKGEPRHNIARLYADGTLDTNFVAGMTLDGIGGMDALPDGRVVVGYQQFWWTVCYVVRLLPTGTVDSTFGSPGLAYFLGSVKRAPGDKVYVNGFVTDVNGFQVHGFIRLNSNGSWDRTFNYGMGYSDLGMVSSYALQPDGRLVVGGDMTQLSGVALHYVARLGAGGGLDTSFNPGLGADNVVNCVRLQPDGKALVSGPFTRMDGIPRARLARLNADGAMPPGIFCFSSDVFVAGEADTNAIVTVRRAAGANGTVGIDFSTADSSARAGVDYLATNGTLTFGPGETLKTFTVPLIDNSIYESNKTVLVALSTPTGGAVLDAVTTSTLVITNDDSAIEFAQPEFRANEAAQTASINLRRVGVPSGAATVDYVFGGGTATPGTDYIAQTGTVTFAAGETNRSFTIALIDDAEPEAPETVVLVLTNATGRAHVGAQSTATLMIADNDHIGGLAAGFVTGFGVSNIVNALALLPSGQIAVGGRFTLQGYSGLVQLGTDGGLDTEFRPFENPAIYGPGLRVNTLGIGGAGPWLVGGNQNGGQFPNALVLSQVSRGGWMEWNLSPIQKQGVVAGEVLACLRMPDGRWLVAGSFTNLLGQPRGGLAMLLTDGSLDPSFGAMPGADAPVSALALQPDGSVLLGGAFTNVFGVTRSRLARLFPGGSLDADFSPAADSNVLAFATSPGGTIYVGGAFTHVNNQSCPRLVRLLRDGSLDPGFAPVDCDGEVRALAVQCDGSLLAGGSFTNVNGIRRPGVVRILASGAMDPRFDPGEGASGPVNALAIQADGEVLVGGAFTQFDSAPRPALVRLHGDAINGASFVGFATATFTVDEAARSAACTLTRSGNLAGTVSVQVLVTNGTASPGIDFQPSVAEVTFLAGETNHSFLVPIFDDLAVEGSETILLQIVGITGPCCVRRADATLRILDDETMGTPDLSFTPATATPRTVNAVLRQPDGRWLVAGANTPQRRGIIRLLADGSSDPSFQTSPEPFLTPHRSIEAVALQPDGKILIAGTFVQTNISGFGSNHLARLNVDGSWDSSFDPQLHRIAGDQVTSAPVLLGLFALAVQADGRILAGGNGSLYQGTNTTSRGCVFRLNADGSLDSSFAFSLASVRGSASVRAISVLPNHQILVAGTFQTTGTVRSNCMRLNADGTIDPSFQASLGGEVRCLELLSDGRILAGGRFTNYPTAGTNALAGLLPNGGLDSTFNALIDGFVLSCRLERSGKILVAGTFSRVNGVPCSGLARLSPDGSLDQSFDPGLGFDDRVTAVSPQSDGSAAAGGWFSQVDGAVRPGLVRLLDRPWIEMANPPFDSFGNARILAPLRPGLPYVLERSTDFQTWQPVATNTPSASPWIFTDPNATGARGFYQIRRGQL